MILFTILLVALAILIALTVVVIGSLGAAGVVIFGDVIVCIVFIVLLLKWLFKKRRKD